MAKVGERAPPVRLARLGAAGGLEEVNLETRLAGVRAVVIGVPGAFTPVCTRDHVPGFVANAAALRRAGHDAVICVAPNDPWTLAAWAERLDPQGQVEFLSDGNLDLARGLGVTRLDRANHFGERPERYLMITEGCVIARMRVEPVFDVLTCTRAEDVLI